MASGKTDSLQLVENVDKIFADLLHCRKREATTDNIYARSTADMISETTAHNISRRPLCRRRSKLTGVWLPIQPVKQTSCQPVHPSPTLALLYPSLPVADDGFCETGEASYKLADVLSPLTSEYCTLESRQSLEQSATVSSSSKFC